MLPVPDKLFITPNDLRKRYGTFDPNIFSRWQKAGKVEKLRNALYRNSSLPIRGEMDRFLISNWLYTPSYVSLYSALRFHDIIPESVARVTAVSSLKTMRFLYKNTAYTYNRLHPKLFFGFDYHFWQNHACLIATPEKALLDLAYLEPLFSDPNWLEEMRFDEHAIREELNWDNMMLFAHSMQSPTVEKRIGLLLHVYDI